MSYVVRVDQASERTVACRRVTVEAIPFGPQIQATLGEVYRCLDTQPEVARGLNIVVCLAPDFAMGTPVAISVEVEGSFVGDDRVSRFEVPRGRVAKTVHQGPYEALGDAHRAVREWIDRNGERMAGPHWEIYGHWHDDESKIETEVVYLLEG